MTWMSMTMALLALHGVVYPKQSTPRAYEKYVLRVPNERNVPTVRVELAFPSDVRVVSFGDVAGWTLATQTDSAGRVTGATWTGQLAAERFVEFPFVAVNPDRAARLVWRAVQVYGSGERVEWAGPEGSATPASVTVIRTAGWSGAAILGGASLVVSLLSLGLVLRRPSSPARP